MERHSPYFQQGGSPGFGANAGPYGATSDLVRRNHVYGKILAKALSGGVQIVSADGQTAWCWQQVSWSDNGTVSTLALDPAGLASAGTCAAIAGTEKTGYLWDMMGRTDLAIGSIIEVEPTGTADAAGDSWAIAASASSSIPRATVNVVTNVCPIYSTSGTMTGITVEYTPIDVDTDRIGDKFCAVNPETCCPVSTTCCADMPTTLCCSISSNNCAHIDGVNILLTYDSGGMCVGCGSPSGGSWSGETTVGGKIVGACMQCCGSTFYITIYCGTTANIFYSPNASSVVCAPFSAVFPEMDVGSASCSDCSPPVLPINVQATVSADLTACGGGGGGFSNACCSSIAGSITGSSSLGEAAVLTTTIGSDWIGTSTPSGLQLDLFCTGGVWKLQIHNPSGGATNTYTGSAGCSPVIIDCTAGPGYGGWTFTW